MSQHEDRLNTEKSCRDMKTELRQQNIDNTKRLGRNIQNEAAIGNQV